MSKNRFASIQNPEELRKLPKKELSDFAAALRKDIIHALAKGEGHLGSSLGKYLVGCTLYVTLEPCVMCAGALVWSQLDRVVFGASDSKRGFQQANLDLHPKTILSGGVLAEEAKALLDAFFAKKRK